MLECERPICDDAAMFEVTRQDAAKDGIAII
jgi:hypothetical protein